MTVGGSVTIDRVFIWCDYKERNYREGSTVCVYKSWWTQNAMGYYRLWVITVWVISGLTVVK